MRLLGSPLSVPERTNKRFSQVLGAPLNRKLAIGG
jgi:hypothetical protein